MSAPAGRASSSPGSEAVGRPDYSSTAGLRHPPSTLTSAFGVDRPPRTGLVPSRPSVGGQDRVDDGPGRFDRVSAGEERLVAAERVQQPLVTSRTRS